MWVTGSGTMNSKNTCLENTLDVQSENPQTHKKRRFLLKEAVIGFVVLKYLLTGCTGIYVISDKERRENFVEKINDAKQNVCQFVYDNTEKKILEMYSNLYGLNGPCYRGNR